MLSDSEARKAAILSTLQQQSDKLAPEIPVSVILHCCASAKPTVLLVPAGPDLSRCAQTNAVQQSALLISRYVAVNGSDCYQDVIELKS
jgi:hypothetical protein